MTKAKRKNMGRGKMMMRKKNKKAKTQLHAEHRVRTKGRLRLGKIILAPGQIISVAVNKGFNGKKDLGYYFFHNGKKIYLRKKDVDYIGKFEY